MPLSVEITALNFRTVLRDARLREKFSKNDLARRLACCPSYVTAIEGGLTFPSLERVRQLAGLFDLDEAALERAVTDAKAARAAAQVYERAKRRADRSRRVVL